MIRWTRGRSGRPSGRPYEYATQAAKLWSAPDVEYNNKFEQPKKEYALTNEAAPDADAGEAGTAGVAAAPDADESKTEAEAAGGGTAAAADDDTNGTEPFEAAGAGVFGSGCAIGTGFGAWRLPCLPNGGAGRLGGSFPGSKLAEGGANPRRDANPGSPAVAAKAEDDAN
jgi:hypothetical protein